MALLSQYVTKPMEALTTQMTDKVSLYGVSEMQNQVKSVKSTLFFNQLRNVTSLFYRINYK